ncbi:TetR/AcrR family transcriptional regulator [Glaciecola siphonariae]|uniref:TetR/AcrR family transcriptional regulator n=1 Tax=Glaciecola siphonariae TaxID=521012 RepID=A0ABV9LR51_9ALTE
MFIEHASEAMKISGIHTVTMEQIAETAGVSKVVLYRYFDTKEALTNEILNEVTNSLCAVLQEPWSGYGSGMEAMLNVAKEHESAFYILVNQTPDDNIYGQYYERLKSALVARIESVVDAKATSLDDNSESKLLRKLAIDGIALLALNSLRTWLSESSDINTPEAFLAWHAMGNEALAKAWLQ